MRLLELYQKKNRPLILDGATGSVLEIRGYAKTDKVWSARANIMHQDEVFNVHKNYLNAGAEIITTNTFRTNPIALKDSSYSSSDLVKTAVELARSAMQDHEIILAGSNPPAEDCYQVDRKISEYELQNNHESHLNNLLKSGVDILWNETFSHLDEIELVCKYCNSLNIDYTINLYLTNEFRLLSGELFSDAIERILKYNPTVIGFNCFSLNVFTKLMTQLTPYYNFGFYLNCGLSSVNDEQFEKVISPLEYAETVSAYLKSKPVFIGTCCGSNPDHTKQLKDILGE